METCEQAEETGQHWRILQMILNTAERKSGLWWLEDWKHIPGMQLVTWAQRTERIINWFTVGQNSDMFKIMKCFQLPVTKADVLLLDISVWPGLLTFVACVSGIKCEHIWGMKCISVTQPHLGIVAMRLKDNILQYLDNEINRAERWIISYVLIDSIMKNDETVTQTLPDRSAAVLGISSVMVDWLHALKMQNSFNVYIPMKNIKVTLWSSVNSDWTMRV